MLPPSAHDDLLNDIPKLERNCFLEQGLSKILTESWWGILKQEQNITDNSSDSKYWIIDNTGRSQPFLGSLPLVIALE